MSGQKLQMREYIEHMAEELNLKIVSGPEFRRFERWMLKPVERIVKKAKPPKRRIRGRVPAPVPVPKVIKDQTNIGIKIRGVPTKVKGSKKVPTIGRVRIPPGAKKKKVPCPYCDVPITLTKRGLIPASHMIQHKRVGGKIVSPISTPEPKKKRTEKKRKPKRTKTMRALRKINGVKVFSFPDHVWKVKELGSKTKKRR